MQKKYHHAFSNKIICRPRTSPQTIPFSLKLYTYSTAQQLLRCKCTGTGTVCLKNVPVSILYIWFRGPHLHVSGAAPNLLRLLGACYGLGAARVCHLPRPLPKDRQAPPIPGTGGRGAPGAEAQATGHAQQKIKVLKVCTG